jgi:secreted trypsin-like serine protease
MRAFAATILATLAFAVPAQAVVGGAPVPPGSFDYVANVRVMGVFGCTGTLIAREWVVTAGHCGSATGSLSQGLLPSPTAFPPEAYEVVLGSVYADGRGGTTYGVSEVRVEPDYAIQNGAGNDVTLMKLSTPALFAPVRIAAAGERELWRPGDVMTVAGFGLTEEEAEEPPEQMHSTQVPITTDDYCADAYPEGIGAGGDAFDPRTMVCAGYPEGKRDTCSGDSGGPLLAPRDDGLLRLVGATSFGDGCGRANKPGVYARLAEGPLREWIRGVVPEAFAPEPAPARSNPVKKAKRKRCAKPRLRGKTRKQRARAMKRYRACKRRAARRR